MSARPQPLPFAIRWRSNLIQAPILFLATAVCGTLALIVSLFDKTGRSEHRIARIWARACLFASGSQVTVRGAENLQKHPLAVYAANHTSFMDIPVVFSRLPFQFRILAKKELWQWPFIGWYLNRSGQIPIDTANPHATLSSLGAGVKALRSGMPLFVFPEGRRTETGELNEFLSGAAFLAIRAQVPIVPLALTGGYDLLPMHSHHFFPVPLTLTAGEPIETRGITLRQADELTGKVRASIENLLNSAAQLGAEPPTLLGVEKHE
ncbi:MAG TPA: lysophospholipid acyltransferase family protein [Terracidiphilus sp.]|nr:lysophospholipid acyltransferase family protein [Terracidiphilus sp.]